jgi:hypothetical protein
VRFLGFANRRIAVPGWEGRTDMKLHHDALTYTHTPPSAPSSTYTLIGIIVIRNGARRVERHASSIQELMCCKVGTGPLVGYSLISDRLSRKHGGRTRTFCYSDVKLRHSGRSSTISIQVPPSQHIIFSVMRGIWK